LSTGEEWSATIKGVLFMFMAVFSAVAYAILIKKLIQKYNGLTITAYQNLSGIFLFLPFFLLWDLEAISSAVILKKSIFALLFLGIFGSSVTFILFANGVRKLGASKANVFANLIPVFTAIASFFILNEAMPALKIAGIMIVLVGLFLSQVKSLRKRRSARQIYFPH
jgi:drug/metabolite transporter (DMT)-like permease